MFHVELRQFPNVTRAFNLGETELRERILGPWLAGSKVVLNDRSWSPEKAKLTIYEGPQIRSEEMGLGRGWANVTRAGREVTEELLARAHTATRGQIEVAADGLKGEIVERAGQGGVALADVLRMVNAGYPDWRVSERLALAERSVWELLHQGEVRMLRGGKPVDAGRWETIVLSWETWSGEPAARAVLEATPPHAAVESTI